MARRSNEDFKRIFHTIASIVLAFEKPEFNKRFDIFHKNLLKGYLSKSPWRENKDGCFRGIYYELREFCDNFLLPWPYPGETLMDFIVTESPNLPYFPTDQQLNHFRMARTGLGEPSDEEIKKIQEIGANLPPHNAPRFDLKGGLTYQQISELDNVTVRTVQNNVHYVRDFLTRKKYLLEGYENPIVSQALQTHIIKLMEDNLKKEK